MKVQIEELVNQLMATNNSLCDLRHLNSKSSPLPPASISEIQRYEKEFGFAFPPSYRAFLELHNGWQNFPLNTTFFSLEKQSDFLKRTKKMDPEFSLHPIAAESPDAIIFLDPSMKDESGEMPLILVSEENGEDKISDFISFLNNRILSINMLII